MSLRCKLLWFACVLVTVAGYSLVYHPYEDAIADAAASRESVTRAIDENLALLGRREVLAGAGNKLERSLRTLDLSDDPRILVALYVRDAARIASEHHVRITALATLATPREPVAPSAVDVPTPPFARTPLDLTLEGTYGDLLATIRTLSRARVLANVDLASLELADTPQAAPMHHLDAHLHIELESLLQMGAIHVRPRST
jgi:hypothetical protein